MKIIDVRPKWMEEFDNVPTFDVLVSEKPSFTVYQERDTLYVAQDGVILCHFSYDGKPNEGFGGWRRTVTMLDGTTRDIVGGWYSGAHSINSVFPELLCTDCGYTASHDDWQRGYTFTSSQVLLEELVAWYAANRHKVDWSLYLFNTCYGPMVVPGKGRFVKPMPDMSDWLARLFPDATPPQERPKWAQTPQQLTNYFMGRAREAWEKRPKLIGTASLAQEQAISA